MIEGLALGAISFVSMLMTWRNLPEWFKSWCSQHPLAAEWLSTLSAFLLMTNVSSSLAAVLGAALYGLLANIAMALYQWVNGRADVAELRS